MKTHYSVTYSPDVNANICIVNRMEEVEALKYYCKMHSDKLKSNFSTTQHHYLVTEWDENDNIINQFNLEEINYYEGKKTI